ncbi:MAG: UPF0262 family protein [Proteobacteria bacterium]|nr:UPF0262 family protein [Pseudomonadota bacterium]
MTGDSKRLIKIALEEESAIRRSPEVEHERAVAVYDLLAENVFDVVGSSVGPYCLLISIRESRLVLDIRDGEENPIEEIILPLSPLRSLVRDYFKVCEAYYEAIKTASPSRIEAIDMGRRGIHDEGAEKLRRRLAPKIEMDAQTSRRLFTLICVLHVRDWRE